MQFFPFGFEQGEASGPTELLGGKGAGLLWLANAGVPVPPGFVIPTTVWAEYDKKPKTVMKEIAKALPQYLAQLEQHFGYMPLLSVRSGARVSCPGMMDTILNVGIDGDSMPAWMQRLGPTCFGDSFHRLVTMYGQVVAGIRKEALVGSNLKESLEVYQQQTGQEFPNAQNQLLGAIEAVFKSWDNDRAKFYRQQKHIPREWGTAVTVQAMVFGNLNDQSATGVLFTRNPDTGVMVVTGEWLPNTQGEDVVAGISTGRPLDDMKEWNASVYDQLLSQVISLESQKKDMLDIEWTVQDGKLYLLQVRTGQRSATAAMKIAVDMAKQGLIEPKVAAKRVSAQQFDRAQLASVDPKFTKQAAFQGIPACSGVVSGKPVFSKTDAINCKEPCILITHETTPDDIAGMQAARGVVTMVGGLTSHAAVVARGMDRACIVGVGQSVEAFKDVEVLSMDGTTGRIWTETIPILSGSTNGVVREYSQLVCETLQVVPVIFKVPDHPMLEALLYLGDQILNPAKAAATVLGTLGQVKHLYLDLTASDEEMRYLSIVSDHDHVGRVLELLHNALVTKHDRLTLICPASYKTTFSRIAPGADLRSIVLSEQEIVMSGVDVSDPAVQKVLAWKKADGGLKVVSLGAYLPGSKCMISVSHALQLLGEQ